MKSVLSLILVLPVSTVLWAQGEGAETCDCEQDITLTDGSCAGFWDDCTAPDADYASRTFTASCTGHYTLKVSISCDGGSCSDYNVCALLYDSGGTFLGHCYDLANCSQCNGSCQTLCLFSGRSYTLYVGLQACGQTPCPSPVTCTAKGVLTYCGPLAVTCQ